VRRKFRGRGLRRGVSDLVVILALVAIAIPAAIAVQQWLSSQSSRISSYAAIPSISPILVSKSVNNGRQTFVIKLENTGTNTYSLSGVSATVVFVNGSASTASISTISGGSTLEPSASAVVYVTVTSNERVASVIIELLNVNTGKSESITLNLA